MDTNESKLKIPQTETCRYYGIVISNFYRLGGKTADHYRCFTVKSLKILILQQMFSEAQACKQRKHSENVEYV